jgi:hypothetical protein
VTFNDADRAVDPSTDIVRYAWADAEQAVEGLSLLFVRPKPSRLAAGLTVRDELPGKLTLHEAQDELTTLDDFAWGSEYVQVDELGDWAVFVSPWGWATAGEEITAAISAGGEAVSLFWNVNAVMSVVVAKDARVVRSFDPLLYDGGGALPEELGLPFGEPGSPRAAALVLAERLTGRAVDLDWLISRRRQTFRVALPPIVAT